MTEGIAKRANGRQYLASLLAAVVLIALTIAIVTAKFGETPVAALEAREEAVDQRIEQAEERREAAEERREEAAEEGR
jgi:F0F1-type ATP synthase membrane subunit b/b'